MVEKRRVMGEGEVWGYMGRMRKRRKKQKKNDGEQKVGKYKQFHAYFWTLRFLYLVLAQKIRKQFIHSNCSVKEQLSGPSLLNIHN